MDQRTERQKKICDIIKTNIENYGYPPTIREILAQLDINTTCVVHKELQDLEDMGYIRRDPTKPRAIEILNPDENKGESLSNIDSSASCMQIMQIKEILHKDALFSPDNVIKTVTVPNTFPQKDECFAYLMKGNSMVERGIYDGDTLFFEIKEDIPNGDIVAAIADDQSVVGILTNEEILPANASMNAIHPQNLEVMGRLFAVIRFI